MKLNRVLAVVTALLLAMQLPLTALADVTADVSLGDVSIGDTVVTHTKESGGSPVTENHGGSVTVTQSNPSTPTTNTITVTTEQKDVTVTLNNVNITAEKDGRTGTYTESAMTVNAGAGTTVTVELDGDNNKLTGDAGLAKKGQGNLTIQDESGDPGTLNATGSSGAGIGGEIGGDAENITITGGTVNAFSQNGGAGIGGGNGINANGEVSGHGNGSNITITGGTVKAWSNNANYGSRDGAGIGGGEGGDGSNITITGGTVNAQSWGDGAGIGGGKSGGGSDITISGGEVTAESHSDGAGIGGGYDGDGSNITISGGTVKAQSRRTGASIGGGVSGDGSNITVSGDAKVTVDYQISSSGEYAIGGGLNVNRPVAPDTSGLYNTGYIQYGKYGKRVYGALDPNPSSGGGEEAREAALYTIRNEARDISATVTKAGLKLLEKDLTSESLAALTEGVAEGNILRTCNLSFDKDYSGSITLRFLLGADYAGKTVEIRTLADGEAVAREVTTDANGTATLRTATLGDFAVILK